jgi:RNA polymerase sigma-70 factor, ECF subfamily
MSGETFANLLAPNLQPLRRLVRTRLRTSDHADDVLQQTLLLAFARRDQLRVQSKFKSWLWSIAFNEIRAFLRGSRPHVSLDEFPNFEPVDYGYCPLKTYEQTERAERLQAGMASLNERDRIAIRLVDFNGMTIPEAAGKLAVSEAAVKSTHYRARQRLGHALGAPARSAAGAENCRTMDTIDSNLAGIRTKRRHADTQSAAIPARLGSAA